MIRVVCGVLIAHGRVLVARRNGGHHAGLWEFPGGKIEGSEAAAAALVRELAEELQIVATVGQLIATSRDERVELAAFRVVRWSGTPTATVHDAVAWVDGPQLSGLAMPPVDLNLLAPVLDLLPAA